MKALCFECNKMIIPTWKGIKNPIKETGSEMYYYEPFQSVEGSMTPYIKCTQYKNPVKVCSSCDFYSQERSK